MKYVVVLRAVVVALVLSVALASGAAAFVHPAYPGWHPPDQLNASLNARPQYVFLIILDGGLPAYLNLGSFPHIAQLEREGTTYSRAWDGMLESETPAAHATIGTGSLPRRHGVVSFGWYTDQGMVERPTDPAPIAHGQLEHLLKISGVPSIASELKQSNRNDMVVVTSGHKDYAVDAVGGWAADYLMYYANRNQVWSPIAIPRHVPPRPVMTAPGLTKFAPHLAPGDQDYYAVALALSAFQRLHEKLTIINIPEFDWPLGHLGGGLASRNRAYHLMQRFDGDLGVIEAELKSEHILNKTMFVLTADHGMVTLNHSVFFEDIEKAVSDAGTTLGRYDFHTGGFLWLRDRSKARQAAENILALHSPYVHAIYYRKPGTYQYVRASDLHSLASARVDQAYQYLLSTFAGPNAPTVVMFLAENTSIRGRNQSDWRGDHGGASWNVQHVPLIISGPGIRKAQTSRYPATIYDIAPTILAMLGVQPHDMDGLVLSDAMTSPEQAWHQEQAARAARFGPLVHALMYQSHVDGP